MWRQIWNFFKKKESANRKSEKFDSNTLVQTPTNLLQLGMYVSELDMPWLESPFLFQGFTIETDKELQTLRDVCQYVYIDISKQKKRLKKGDDIHFSNKGFVIGQPLERLGTFEEEIDRADITFKNAGELVETFMDEVANGGTIDGTVAKQAVAACVNSILHSPDAFLWLTQLKKQDKYTAQHSLNVCVLSIVLARHIGLSVKQLNHVGLCGMMHDMGKMLIPLEVLNKPGKLTPDEMLLMKTHTTLGYELLKSSSNMFPGAVETALTHHEHMDGKGYPRRLKANKLSYYSNIVAVADIYDAITSDRVYQKGRTHHEATKIMIDVSESHLEGQLVIKFIESLGAYPPGSFVELSDRSIAVVIEENTRFRLRPKVLSILDADKNAIAEKVIDLSEMSLDAFGKALMIRAIIRPSDYQIDTMKYYQEGIMQKGFARK